jgi:hypothetical protein
MRLHPAVAFAEAFLSTVLSIWSVCAIGASPAEEAFVKLTGGTSRLWVFKEMRKFMGPNPACLEGETYKFSSDNSVTIEQCLSGRISNTTLTWSIAESGPLNIIITINEERFILLFRASGDKHFMRLRTPAESKLFPTVDKEFRLSEE